MGKAFYTLMLHEDEWPNFHAFCLIALENSAQFSLGKRMGHGVVGPIPVLHMVVKRKILAFVRNQKLAVDAITSHFPN
jgi:hypothetical protein